MGMVRRAGLGLCALLTLACGDRGKLQIAPARVPQNLMDSQIYTLSGVALDNYLHVHGDRLALVPGFQIRFADIEPAEIRLRAGAILVWLPRGTRLDVGEVDVQLQASHRVHSTTLDVRPAEDTRGFAGRRDAGQDSGGGSAGSSAGSDGAAADARVEAGDASRPDTTSMLPVDASMDADAVPDAPPPVLVCPPGTADCDGDPLTGCESVLTASTSCGACGNVCGPRQSCRAGACVLPDATTQIQARGTQSCALRNGSLWCWGRLNTPAAPEEVCPSSYRASQVGSATDWTQIAIGRRHACGIRAGGSLWCWGYNFDGQLGLGDTGSRGAPTQVEVGQAWQQVATGDDHTCAVRADGTLWCWGENDDHEVVSAASSRLTSPQLVSPDTDWVALALGDHHTCGLRADWSLWCWGRNASGQIGNGTTAASQATPVQVAPGAQWMDISAWEHTCALRSDRSLWCWGDNSYGQLGLNDRMARSTPARVTSDEGWLQVSAGSRSTCGLRPGGEVWCWGHVADFSDGSMDLLSPEQALAEAGWEALTSGYRHLCLQRNGEVHCLGRNSYCQVAPSQRPTTVVRTPTMVPLP